MILFSSEIFVVLLLWLRHLLVTLLTAIVFKDLQNIYSLVVFFIYIFPTDKFWL